MQVIVAYLLLFAKNLCICTCTNPVSDVSSDVAYHTAMPIDSASIPRIRCVRKGHLGRDLAVRWPGLLLSV